MEKGDSIPSLGREYREGDVIEPDEIDEEEHAAAAFDRRDRAGRAGQGAREVKGQVAALRAQQVELEAEIEEKTRTAIQSTSSPRRSARSGQTSWAKWPSGRE